MSALSSGKIYKYEYCTGEEILPFNQQQMIEQAKFTYSPLGKAFEKQTKTIEDQGEKQVNALKSLESSDKQLPSIKDFISNEKLSPEIRKVKEDVLSSAMALLKEREMVFKAFESGIFLKTEELKQGTGLKILTPKQMPQRLPIALAQIKAGNNSESLLNEIRQIVYSIVYNNIIESIKV